MRSSIFEFISREGVLLGLAAILLAACGEAGQPGDNESRESTRVQAQEQLLFAEAAIEAVGESRVSGNVHFEQRAGLLQIRGELVGLSPGLHGLHIHKIGDCSDAGAAAGPHFSPEEHPHGSPNEPDDKHHAGDLGNVTADESGVAEFELVDTELRLGAEGNSIVGRAVVVHENADDLATQPAGNAGARTGCGVIHEVLRPAYVVE